MKQKALLFYAPWGSDRVSVEAEFLDGSIRLVNLENPTSSPLLWPIHQVALEFGGAHNHLLFFKRERERESEAQTSFYLEAQSELVACLKASPGVPASWHKSLHALGAERRKSLFWTLAPLVVLVLAVGFVYFKRNEIISYGVSKIPYKTEVAIGERVFGLAFPPSKRVNNAEALQALETLLAPLRKSIPSPYNTFQVHISNDGSLNAFATPGGQVVFNQGLLLAAETGSEVLGVAAHELAHVRERHGLKGAFQSLGLFAVVQAFFGDVTGIIAVAMDSGRFINDRYFSREMESEADRLGFESLVDARISPLGMKTFFKKIMDVPRVSDPKLNETLKKIESGMEVLSTHPDTLKRLEDIQKRYDNLDQSIKGQLRESQTELRELKRALKKEGAFK